MTMPSDGPALVAAIHSGDVAAVRRILDENPGTGVVADRWQSEVADARSTSLLTGRATSQTARRSCAC